MERLCSVWCVPYWCALVCREGTSRAALDAQQQLWTRLSHLLLLFRFLSLKRNLTKHAAEPLCHTLSHHMLRPNKERQPFGADETLIAVNSCSHGWWGSSFSLFVCKKALHVLTVKPSHSSLIAPHRVVCWLGCCRPPCRCCPVTSRWTPPLFQGSC